MAGFNDAPVVQQLAVPAVCILIAFLGYFSQLLFHRSSLDPGPPSGRESILFNLLLLSLWYSYFRSIITAPGRFSCSRPVVEVGGRWCKKCVAPKPPRAHHCRHCGRCIPKMDHHCPWTRNCVSMTTFPHFLRFLIYANLSLWALARLLWLRFYALWEARNLPAYLGPTIGALIGLSLTSLICLFTTLTLGIMLATTINSWLFNCTMIERWEIDRHEAAVDRAGSSWWDDSGAEGAQVEVEKVEFPYDIGFFANMAQAMGTRNILLWLWPFAGNPVVGEDGRGHGWEWEENGFNRRPGMWPPPDPDKPRRWRAPVGLPRDYSQELRDLETSPEEQKQAMRRRQEEDARRRKLAAASPPRNLVDESEYESETDSGNSDGRSKQEAHTASAWLNADAERLHDYGVDEDAELSSSDEAIPHSDEDVPLGELLRRRQAYREGSDG